MSVIIAEESATGAGASSIGVSVTTAEESVASVDSAVLLPQEDNATITEAIAKKVATFFIVCFTFNCYLLTFIPTRQKSNPLVKTKLYIIV